LIIDKLLGFVAGNLPYASNKFRKQCKISILVITKLLCLKQ